MSQCPEQWKLDVNDRYQKAVSTIVSLATAALVVPVLYLQHILAKTQPLTDMINAWVYSSWLSLGASILAGIIYYYASAKWVKLSWQKPADMFGINVTKAFVEWVLDKSYFVMMVGFVLGLVAIVVFMATVH